MFSSLLSDKYIVTAHDPREYVSKTFCTIRESFWSIWLSIDEQIERPQNQSTAQ